MHSLAAEVHNASAENALSGSSKCILWQLKMQRNKATDFMDCGKARQRGFMSRTFSSVLKFVDLVKYKLFVQQRHKSASFCWIIALRAQLLLTMIAIQVEWRKIFQRWFLSWGTFVTTSKHFGRKDCILKRVDEFYSRLFMVRTSPWKGEDGHDWNMIMSATPPLKRGGGGMASRIKGVILGRLCKAPHLLSAAWLYDPTFTAMARTPMASVGKQWGEGM